MKSPLFILCAFFLCINYINAQENVLIGLGTQENGSVYTYHPSEDELIINQEFSPGKNPTQNELIESGGKLWGMTPEGGTHGYGVIFRLDSDGSNYEKVHDFDNTNGSSPTGSLLEVGDNLWGMTPEGGAQNNGVIFSIKNDGTNFTKIYDLTQTGGAKPNGNLVEYNERLWGVAPLGGENIDGTIFYLELSDSSFNVVHEFNSELDTEQPTYSLTVVDTRLWGVTKTGSMFRINSDGEGFALIDAFEEANIGSPTGPLLYHDDKIWGVTGPSDGYLFSINKNGSGITTVNNFSWSDGYDPVGSLVAYNNKIWGVTTHGGLSKKGIIYGINPDGSGFQTAYIFKGEDKGFPLGGLMKYDDGFYGMASDSDESFASYGDGTIYRLDTEDLADYDELFQFCCSGGRMPSGTLTLDDYTVWGLKSEGGTYNNGMIYTMDKFANKHRIVYHFKESDGSDPIGNLLRSGDVLFGVNRTGGAFNYGTIYTINVDGTGFKKIHDFNEENGSLPNGFLIEYDNKIWGTTSEGGSSFQGTIFSISTDGTNFNKEYDFSTNTGTYPYGGLISLKDTLWGTTKFGGENGHGVVFGFETSQSVYEPIHHFDGTNGANPTSGLITYDNKLWGTTSLGGSMNLGVLYNITTDGTTFTKKHDFISPTGSSPIGGLVILDDKLWGLTKTGGSNGVGVIFSLDLTNDSYTKQYDLNGVTGTPPEGSTLLAFERKLEQDLSFPMSNKTYGDTPFELVATSETENEITFATSNSDIISIDENNIATIHNKGLVTLYAYQSGDTDYEFEAETKPIEVKPFTLNIAADPQTKPYGADDPALTFTSLTLFGDDQFTGELTRERGLHPGNYLIKQYSLDAGSNYDIVFKEDTLKITKAPLTTTADDLIARIGDDVPELTISYSGFVGDEDISVLDELPIAEVGITEVNTLGEYEIIVSGGLDNDYEFLIENGKLTVLEALSIIKKSTLQVYPNPAQDEVRIALKSRHLVEQIVIVDLLGKEVANFSVSTEGLYNISHLESGTYLILTKSSGILEFGGKLIKE